MQLPNKLYSYEDSTLSLIPIVLKEIGDEPYPIEDLFEAVKPALKDSTDFLSVMDCLYALREIDINDEKEVYRCSKESTHQSL